MTQDEFAAHVRDSGTRVVQCKGVYWVEQKPFFFRPLLPLQEILPDPGCYPFRTRFGGVQHCVPDAGLANSQKQHFIFDDLQGYALTSLPHPRANKIRKGLKLFEWRRITDHSDFVDQAFPVYVSFARRTRYSFKRERRDRTHFGTWARALFTHRNVMVCGAYTGDRLRAVSVFFLVERKFLNGVYFSDTESQPLQVHDFVLHKLREVAAGTDADYVYMGPHTGVEGIDRAKVIRGCKLISKRTHLRLNPVVGAALRYLRLRDYVRLLGVNPPTGVGSGNTSPEAVQSPSTHPN